MDEAEATLESFGLDSAHIRRESFDLVLNDDDDEPPMRVNGEILEEPGECEQIIAVVYGEEIEVIPKIDESILDSLVRAEVDVPFSCQEGTCSSCISKITAGSIDIRSTVLKTLREDDLGEGLVLACLCKPMTRKVRIDFDNI